jgi:hypothetical protein
MLISFVVLVLVLIGCCYLPIFTIFHDHSRRVSLAQSWMYMTVGLGSLGMLVIWAKAAGVDMKASVLPGGLVSMYALIRYGRNCLPQVRVPKWDGHTLAALIISAIYFLHILIPGILMGRGNYPPVFFSVDTPFYLGQIHALIRSDAWPPISLSSLGVSFGYHYGAQSVCALLASLTGFTPHASGFLIFMPITTLGILSVAWLIIQRNGTERCLLWIGLLFLLFASYYQIGRILTTFYRGIYQTVFHAELLAIPRGLFSSFLLNPEMFSSFYPMPSSQFGFFIAIALISCLQHIFDASHQRLAAFIVGILMIFKSPDFLSMGLGFGVWIVYEIYRTHNVKLLLSPLTALLIGIILYGISKPGESLALIIAPWQLIRAKSRFTNIVGSIMIYTLPVWVKVKSQASFTKNNAVHYWFFIVPVLLVNNIFGLVRTQDHSLYNSPLFETTHLIPVFLGMSVFAFLQGNWAIFTRHIRAILSVVIVIITLLPFSHQLLHTCILLVAPEYGHEYVNNKPLAEALATIPVNGSVIVTNDFRYPAENYKKDLRQTQFPALFGHQMYAVNFLYERYPDSQKRLKLQQRFRNPAWDQELETLAQQLGWTHLVIRRAAPHPREIPLPLIFENDMYQVYVFKSIKNDLK